MTAPRVLLVEALDATGCDVADAREHGAVLQAAGARARVVSLIPDLDGVSAEPDANGTSSTVAQLGAGRAGLEALRGLVRGGRFDLALVAGASPGGGPAARAISPLVPTRWWPTGIAPAGGWRARLGLVGGGVPAAVGATDVPGSGATAGLAWSTVERSRSGRGRFALWDGDYVLAPLALGGEEGARIVSSFAEVAAQSSGLDLIVLADPQPAFERQARALGIGNRVHFVGPAPREAEWAWWAHASAAVLAGRGPLAGGMVLRGLTVGCPMLADSAEGPCAAVAAWLAHHECTPPVDAGTTMAGTLMRMLERGPAIEQVRRRGLALAARHDPALIGQRLMPELAGLLPASAASRRAAA